MNTVKRICAPHWVVALVFILLTAISAQGKVYDFSKVRLYLTSGMRAQAIEELENLLNSDAVSDSRILVHFGLGVIYAEDGNFEKARFHLNKSLEGADHLADYTYYYLGKINADIGAIDQAESHFSKVLRTKYKSRRYYLSRFELAKIAIQKRHWNTAYRHLRSLERKFRNEEQYPELILNLAKSEYGRRRRWKGCRWLRKLYSKYPSHELVEDWGINLHDVKINNNKSNCIASPSDQAKRIKNLQYAGQSDQAYQEIKELQKRTMGHKLYDVDSILANYYIFQGRIEEAIDLLDRYMDKKGKDPSFLKTIASAGSRLGNPSLSSGAYYRAYKNSRYPRMARGNLFMSAFTSYQFKDYDGAQRKFKELLGKYRRSGLRHDSKWYLAWVYYLKEDYTEAYSRLQDLLYEQRRLRKPHISIEKIKYWSAVTLLKMDQKQEAKKELTEISQNPAFSFYSFAAKARLTQLEDVPIVRGPANINKIDYLIESSRWREIDEIDESESTVVGQIEEIENVIDEEDREYLIQEEDEERFKIWKDSEFSWIFQRANDLVNLGFETHGKWELYEIEKRTSRKRYLNLLLKEYESSNQHHRSSYIADIYFSQLRNAAGVTTAKNLWESSFPKVYEKEIDEANKQFGVSKEFLWSIMRAESRYRKNALSYVGAIGLMQMMPFTGQRVANLLGDKTFDPMRLYEPETSVKYGARYLQRLLNQFENKVPLAAAAYNAGPHRVKAWLRYFGSRSMDEFIEHIPFMQTRNYVKKVMRNHYIYTMVYSRDNLAASALQIVEPINVPPPRVIPTKEMWN